jgi:hypothetical protein
VGTFRGRDERRPGDVIAPDAAATGGAAEWRDVLLPIGTLILGGLLALLGEVRRDRRQERRERLARQEQRAIAAAEERAAFERKALLEVQDALEDLGRATAHDHERLRDEQAWQKPGGMWSDEYRDASARLNKLIARVFDDDLRKLLVQIRQEARQVVIARSEEDSWEAYKRVDATAGEFNEKVAPTLRRLFEPPSE